MLADIQVCVIASDICQRTGIKSLKNRPYHPRILVDYSLVEVLSVDIKFILKGFDDFKYLLITTCEITNFVLAILNTFRTMQVITKDWSLQLYYMHL